MTTRAVAAAAIAALIGGAGLIGCAPAAADEAGVVLRTGELSLAVGEAGALSVTVLPGDGRTVSGDGPVRLIVDGGEGVTLPRKRYGRRDAADPAALAPRFDVKIRARAPGDHAVTIEARLWLCGPKLCKPVRVTRTVTVQVFAPPPIDAGVDASIDAGIEVGIDAGRPRSRRR